MGEMLKTKHTSIDWSAFPAHSPFKLGRLQDFQTQIQESWELVNGGIGEWFIWIYPVKMMVEYMQYLGSKPEIGVYI